MKKAQVNDVFEEGVTEDSIKQLSDQLLNTGMAPDKVDQIIETLRVQVNTGPVEEEKGLDTTKEVLKPGKQLGLPERTVARVSQQLKKSTRVRYKASRKRVTAQTLKEKDLKEFEEEAVKDLAEDLMLEGRTPEEADKEAKDLIRPNN